MNATVALTNPSDQFPIPRAGGIVNQASWLGERAHFLLDEIARLEKYETLVTQLREWLKRGATIRATSGEPEVLNAETGFGGLDVTFKTTV